MPHKSHRQMSCHWACDSRWVKISGHSEQLGPCGSTSHFVNNRYSRVKTRDAPCIGGFGQTNGQKKFELVIPKSRGASYIRAASYIRDKTVILVPRRITLCGPWCNRTNPLQNHTRSARRNFRSIFHLHQVKLCCPTGSMCELKIRRDHIWLCGPAATLEWRL